MDFMLFLQAVLSLAFVIGLMLVVCWLMKYCEQRGCKNPFLKKFNVSNRLEIVESKRIDARNTLAIMRCDDDEFVVLVGASQNLLLKAGKINKNA